MKTGHKPTPNQLEVLQSSENLIVVGRPGTGKTSVALWKAAKFIRDNALEDYQRVLFLSFSKAAVDRIRAESGEVLTREQRRFLRITTFHAFCHRILSSHYRHVGLASFEILPPEEVSLLRAKEGEEDAVEKKVSALEDQGRISLDRFAPLCASILRENPLIRSAYGSANPLVMVDEYQDTDDDQEELVEMLAEESQVVCLGDPDQRIYDWRKGCRDDRMKRLQESGGFRAIELENQNHRSGGADIVPVARAVLDSARSIKKPKSVIVRPVQNHKSISKVMKQAILSLERAIKKARKDRPPTIAIMCVRNAFVGTLSKLLREPSDGFERPFSHHVLLPSDELLFAWRAALALLEPVGDASKHKRLVEVLRQAENIYKLRRSKGGDVLGRWIEEIDQGKLSGRMKAAVQLNEASHQLRAKQTGNPYRDLCDVREMLRSLPGNHFGPVVSALDLRLPAGAGEPLADELREVFEAHGSYTGARKLGEQALLKERMLDGGAGAMARRVLFTLHKSKGKEFDAVIIVEGVSESDELVLWEEREKDKWPRSRRVLAVAMTRARFAVVILTPRWQRCRMLPQFRGG